MIAEGKLDANKLYECIKEVLLVAAYRMLNNDMYYPISKDSTHTQS